MATKVTKKKTAVVNAEKTETKKKTAVKKPASSRKAVAKSESKKEKVVNLETVKNNSNAYLMIDHPVEMETIYGNHYAVRIGASSDGYVEIAFDNGEWHPCRFDAGYWWFDWTYFPKGNHSMSVRLVDANGSVIMETSPRKCIIC